MELMWARIYDLVIKSFLCVESHIYNAHKRTGKSMNCNFQLFGYDILLDQQLNPWILEVNLSPSLAADSPIDRDIKTNLITDMFNLVGIRKTVVKNTQRRSTVKNNFVKSPSNKINSSFIARDHSPSSPENPLKRRFKKEPLEKTAVYEHVEVSVLEKISRISAKHRSIVLDFLAESERNVRLNFTRIYPALNSDYYDKFFESDRPVNKLVHRYLFRPNELSPLIEQSSFDDLAPQRKPN